MNRGEAAVQLNSNEPSTSNHCRPLWNWPTLKFSEKLWVEVSESSCVEKNIDLIGYNSYSQNFLKIYSRRLHQIVHREKIFFFQKMFEFKIISPVGKVSKKHLERYQVRGYFVSESLWLFQWCWWQNLYFGDKMSLTWCHWLDALIERLSMLVSSVTNIDVVNVTFDFWLSPFKAGEAIGQTIVCMDDSFEVHEWCLFNSDILLSFFEGILFRIRIFSLKWTVMGESGPAGTIKYQSGSRRLKVDGPSV